MKIRFKIEECHLAPTKLVAYCVGDEAQTEAVLAAVYLHIGIYLELTISGVTMFIAAWEDPEHWAEEWAKLLDVDLYEVSAAVHELLDQATED